MARYKKYRAQHPSEGTEFDYAEYNFYRPPVWNTVDLLRALLANTNLHLRHKAFH